MKVGIDASRAFQKQRTGIEEYSYQVIKHLVDKLEGHQVVLYINKAQSSKLKTQNHSLKLTTREGLLLPENWEIRTINLSRFWTQIGLAWEMLVRPVEVLFIPAHTVPFIHPRNTIVTIHGLEYEMMPEAYAWWERFYMCWSIRLSCWWAEKIIAVSKNTKKDLVRLYKVPESKIEVIYEGVNRETCNLKPETKDNGACFTFHDSRFKPYLLFIGRLEKRKNVEGIIEAYKILKEKYNIPHKLVLAGKQGFGYEAISQKLKAISCKKDIIETGYISEKEKYQLLENADIFLFPTFYEGFGLPILEAQNRGVPVVASNVSSFPEVGADSVVYCDPSDSETIANATYKIISEEEFRNGIIKKGYGNVKMFSWEKCADSIAKLLNG